MEDYLNLAKLYSAHIEWLAVRRDLTGQEKRFFHRWVCRVHPDLYRPYGEKQQGAMFRTQCLEIQRGGKAPTTRGLSWAAIKRHSVAIMMYFNRLPEGEHSSFQAFLEHLMVTCPSEAALTRLLEAQPESD